MSCVFVPIIRDNKSELYELKIYEYSGFGSPKVTISAMNFGENEGSDIYIKKLADSFKDKEFSIDVNSLNHNSIFQQFSQSTESIFLGLYSVAYSYLNGIPFRSKYDTITITGNYDFKGDVISLQPIIEIKEKFSAVQKYAGQNKGLHLFIYISDEEIPPVDEKKYENNVTVIRYKSSQPFNYFLAELYEKKYDDFQMKQLPLFGLKQEELFVETDWFRSLKKRVEIQKEKNLLVYGGSYSGKSLSVYNYVKWLMDSNQVYAPIWISIPNNINLQKIINEDKKDSTSKLEFFLLENILNKLALIPNDDEKFETIKQVLNEKKHVIVIDNIEFPVVDEIFIAMTSLRKKIGSDFYLIITSWESLKNTDFLEQMSVEKSSAFSEHDVKEYVDVFLKKAKYKIRYDSDNQITELVKELYEKYNCYPGLMAIEINRLEDNTVIEFLAYIRSLNHTNLDQWYSRVFQRPFDNLDFLSQVVLYALIGYLNSYDFSKFADENLAEELLKTIQSEIIKDKVTVISKDHINKSLEKLSSLNFIEELEPNNFFIKEIPLRFFVFEVNLNSELMNAKNILLHIEDQFKISVLGNYPVHAKKYINSYIFPDDTLEDVLSSYLMQNKVDLNILKLLLDKKEKKNEGVTFLGLTFFSTFDCALMGGNKDVVQFLIEYGIDFTKKDFLGNNIFHLCAVKNSEEMLQYLLGNEKVCSLVDINALNRDGCTPLNLMTETADNTKILDLMLQRGANPLKGKSLLIAAAKNKNPEIIKYVLENKLYYDINECDRDGYNALCYSLMNESVEVFYSLMETDSSYPQNRFCPPAIVLTLYNSNPELLRILLNEIPDSINYNEKGCNLLARASEISPSVEHLKLLVEKGGDYTIIDNEGNSLLFYAVKTNNIEKYEYLKSIGLDKNVVNRKGDNLLLYSARHSNARMFRYLLNDGFDINAKNFKGESIDSLVKKNKNYSIWDYLTDNGIGKLKKRKIRDRLTLSLIDKLDLLRLLK